MQAQTVVLAVFMGGLALGKMEELALSAEHVALSDPRPTSPVDFRAALKGALRTAGLALVFAAVSAETVRAQQVTAKPPSTAQHWPQH